MENLIKAFKHIAYDNGMVNRFEDEKSVIQEMFTNIRNTYHHEDIETVDEFLGTLSEEQLYAFCCDRENYDYKLEDEADVLGDEMLDVAFEGA